MKKLLKVYWLFLKFHLPRKFLLMSIIYFFAKRIMNFQVSLTLSTALGVFIFFLAYSSIYFMNDFLDYDYDRKRRSFGYDKPLVTEKINPAVFAYLAYLHLALGILLAILYSKLFSVLIILTVLIAHLRHLIRNLAGRTALLALLEAGNLLSIGYVIDRNLITDPKFLSFALVFSLFYAVMYLGYRKRKFLWRSVTASQILAAVLLITAALILKFHISWTLTFLGILVLYSLLSGFFFSLKNWKLTENLIAAAQLVGITIFLLLAEVKA